MKRELSKREKYIYLILTLFLFSGVFKGFLFRSIATTAFWLHNETRLLKYNFLGLFYFQREKSYLRKSEIFINFYLLFLFFMSEQDNFKLTECVLLLNLSEYATLWLDECSATVNSGCRLYNYFM